MGVLSAVLYVFFLQQLDLGYANLVLCTRFHSLVGYAGHLMLYALQDPAYAGILYG
jgi:hypothetical protein